MFVKLDIVTLDKKGYSTGGVDRYIKISSIYSFGKIYAPHMDGAKTDIVLDDDTRITIKESPEHLDRLINEALNGHK